MQRAEACVRHRMAQQASTHLSMISTAACFRSGNDDLLMPASAHSTCGTERRGASLQQSRSCWLVEYTPQSQQFLPHVSAVLG